ncbi:MAG: S8 family serine peptidase, partial [Acidobacteriota bacterium]
LPVFAQLSHGGLIPCSQLDLARAIGQAISAGAHILNISGGELSASGQATDLLRKAVQQAVDANVLVVSAVGNDGCECLHVPAALPGVLAVGALDPHGQPLDSSNWAERLARQGVMAPGAQIPGALPGGRFGVMTGSSFATPLVSGVAALLLSLQRARGQKPDPQAVRRALVESAEPCQANQATDCRRLLAGKLNIEGARAALGLGGPASCPPELAPRAGSVGLPIRPSALGRRTSSSAWPGRGVVPQREGGEAAGERGSFGCEGAADLVFALGELGYDFGCDARLDAFVQRMGSLASATSPVSMAKHLKRFPEDAGAVVWTLNQDATPVFAIQPWGSFATKAYGLLSDFLRDQHVDPEDAGADASREDSGSRSAKHRYARVRERLYRVAIAGRIVGTTSLFNGTVVPVIRPVTRGMFNWDASVLIRAIRKSSSLSTERGPVTEAIENLLRRVYYELRNLGLTSQERALNFAGTNAYSSGEVFHDAWRRGLRGLERFAVEPSPICRPDSDCWDVKMTFFDPEHPYERARWIYRYTIDVSDVMPVAVGPVRSWPVHAHPGS